jgi:hypothetical protein
MVYGFGRGAGAGRGFGGGMGFGFRGSSPPWPYIGRGRGGLPRCGYFFGGVPGAGPGAYSAPVYRPPVGTAYPSYAPTMSKDEELDFLREQAEAIKSQLEEIDSRMKELESDK